MRQSNRRSICLMLVLLALNQHFQQIASQCAIKMNVAFTGTDLSTTIDATMTVGKCCALCCAEPSCNSWTYDLTKTSCVLKSSMPQTSRCTPMLMGASGNKPTTCGPTAASTTTTTTTTTATTVTAQNPVAQCTNEATTGYTMTTIGATIVNDAQKCCQDCRDYIDLRTNTKPCKAFTFYTELKVCSFFGVTPAGAGDKSASPTKVSGVVIA